MRDPVPPHRIALRAFMAAPVAGTLAGTGILLGGGIASDGFRGIDGLGMLIFVWLVISVACGAWAWLAMAGREVALHIRSRLRYAAGPFLALFLLFAVSAAGIWVVALVEGRGMQEALQEFGRFLDSVMDGNTFDETLAVAGILGLPFVAWSAQELLERDRVLERRLTYHLAVAGCCGLVMLLLFLIVIAEGIDPDGSELVGIFVAVVSAPMLANLGLWLTDLWEPRLVRWWRARREA